jgi:haloalkane dehalogenase
MAKVAADSTSAPTPPSAGKRYAEVHGRRMAYVDTGQPGGGADGVVVFLHGNPTSSYLWRTVIPHLAPRARCLAPDLIGMGDSEKLPDSGPGSYTFVEHRRYLDGLLDAMDLGGDVTLVLHDWGSALGFDWARRHPDRVRGIAYMEAIVQAASWEALGAARPLFEGLRSPAGEQLVLEQNLFVEGVLPGGVLRTLSEAELAEYRRPFLEPGEGRRPTLSWPRQVPIDGEPADVARVVGDYGSWLAGSDVPKLFVNAHPGQTLTGAAREFCRGWPNQQEITVAGRHLLPEDAGDEIGAAIATWRPAEPPTGRDQPAMTGSRWDGAHQVVVRLDLGGAARGQAPWSAGSRWSVKLTSYSCGSMLVASSAATPMCRRAAGSPSMAWKSSTRRHWA